MGKYFEQMEKVTGAYGGGRREGMADFIDKEKVIDFLGEKKKKKESELIRKSGGNYIDTAKKLYDIGDYEGSQHAFENHKLEQELNKKDAPLTKFMEELSTMDKTLELMGLKGEALDKTRKDNAKIILSKYPGVVDASHLDDIQKDKEGYSVDFRETDESGKPIPGGKITARAFYKFNPDTGRTEKVSFNEFEFDDMVAQKLTPKQIEDAARIKAGGETEADRLKRETMERIAMNKPLSETNVTNLQRSKDEFLKKKATDLGLKYNTKEEKEVMENILNKDDNMFNELNDYRQGLFRQTKKIDLTPEGEILVHPVTGKSTPVLNPEGKQVRQELKPKERKELSGMEYGIWNLDEMISEFDKGYRQQPKTVTTIEKMTGTSPELNALWARFKKFDWEEIHKLAGSNLTSNEEKIWKSTTVNELSHPKVLKEVLAMRLKLLKKALELTKQGYQEGGYEINMGNKKDLNQMSDEELLKEMEK